jgi:hypothetical protein
MASFAINAEKVAKNPKNKGVFAFSLYARVLQPSRKVKKSIDL